VRLYLQAFWQLLRFDYYVRRGNFGLLYERVRIFPCSSEPSSPKLTDQLCHAINIACVWYPKHVLCLQRSAATTCLLRKHGLAAQMVIGVQNLPFKAHAWVELENRTINDKSYTREMYAALDRC
jgi:hypothetical protein